MADYKHRKIELIPKRQGDETWGCAYRIIEFRPTSWGYCKGQPDGNFASREAAVTAALEEAKRIIDSLDCAAQGPIYKRSTVLKTYGRRISKLFAWSSG